MRAFRETVSIAGLLTAAWLVVAHWHTLPARVPIHFGVTGEPNGWGSPHTFVLFPLVALFTWALLSVIVLYPQTFNYPMKTSASGRERMAPMAEEMISWIKLETIWMFAGITWSAVRAARGEGVGMARTVVALGVTATIGTAILYGLRLQREVAR